MEQKKLKSLVAGRILSLVPFVCLALLFLISEISFLNQFAENSQSSQMWRRIMLDVDGFFMIMLTIPSFVCVTVGLILLLHARKKGGKKTLPFIVLCIVGMVLSVLISLFLFSMARGFESTVGQLDKLSKISEIEEFVLTDDSEEGGFHDGTMYNDLDLYLAGGGFLQVSHMSEYLTSFHLDSAGDWQLVSVTTYHDRELATQRWLEQDELSKLCGKKIKKLTDLISCYDSFMQKVEALPLFEEDAPLQKGIFKIPLQREKLALREQVIYDDLLNQPGVSSVKKIKGHYDYLENYWYEISMDDGHSFLMTVSAVFPHDDGSLKSDFCIRAFDGEPISLLSMTNETYGIDYYSPYSDRAFAKKIGEEMRSYRDFFPHYKEFLNLTGELLEESKKAESNPRRNKNSGGGMISGTYSPR